MTLRTGAGHVLSVQSRNLGSALDGDQAAGATTLTVQDCADFDDQAGGLLSLNGTTYTYSSVDDEASTLAISPSLAANGSDGDEVVLLDPVNLQPQTAWSASVTVDGEDPGDTLETDISAGVIDRLAEGVRGVAGESATLQWDENGQVTITDVPGSTVAASGIQAMQDEMTVTGAGDQTLTLTYQPMTNSEHLYWNGVYQKGSEWSRDQWTVTIPDGAGHLQVGDVLAMEYLYTDPTTAPASHPDIVIDLPAYNIVPPGGSPDGPEASYLSDPNDGNEVVISSAAQDIAVGNYGNGPGAPAHYIGDEEPLYPAAGAVPTGYEVYQVQYVVKAYRESGGADTPPDSGGSSWSSQGYTPSPSDWPFLFLDTPSSASFLVLDGLPVGSYGGEVVTEVDTEFVSLGARLRMWWVKSYGAATDPPIHVTYLAARVTYRWYG